MLDNWKRRRAEAKAQQAEQEALEAARRRAEQHRQAMDYWHNRLATVQYQIEAAETFAGGEPHEAGGFVLKKDERPYAVIAGCVLIEPRRAPGHYEGGHQGMSFRVAKGVTYRTGGSRGTYVPGPESPTPIDQGDVLISNQRVVFRGAKQTREWRFDKLLGYDHDERDGWTALQVSNRQKTSGVAYGPELSNEFQFRLGLALAEHGGSRAGYVALLRQQEQQIQAAKPTGG